MLAGVLRYIGGQPSRVSELIESTISVVNLIIKSLEIIVLSPRPLLQ